MRILLFIFIFSAGLYSCVYEPDRKSWREMKDEMRAKNALIEEREYMLERAYTIAETDAEAAIKFIDSLILNDKGENNYHEQWRLAKGYIYYSADSLQKALMAFNDYLSRYPYTDGYLGRACVNMKLKDHDVAYKDLYMSGYDIHVNLGKYFDVLKNKDSALVHYRAFQEEDAKRYLFCLERIKELSNSHPRYLTEFTIIRPERVLMTMEPVDNPFVDRMMEEY